MRVALTIIMTFFILNFVFGQSPFNYGQNEKVYFISADLRNKLDIKTIYTAEKNFLKNNGGMGKKWNVTALSFDTNNVIDYRDAISLNSTFNFNFDSLSHYLHNAVGTRYNFTNSLLVNYGGGSMGNYYWTLITRYSDTLSIVSSCTNGAASDALVNYSKNVFSKQGRLLYTIFYPPSSDRDHRKTETMTSKEFQEFLNSILSAGKLPDTLHYKYDNKGLLLNASKENSINNSTEVKRLFIDSDNPSTSKFHQCYVGNIKMEKFIFKNLGFNPKLILIEIYRLGVFSFSLNSVDKKYYRTKDIILER